MRVTRLRASPRHGGSTKVEMNFVTDPPRGCPFGGGGIPLDGIQEYISKKYGTDWNYLFMRVPTSGPFRGTAVNEVVMNFRDRSAAGASLRGRRCSS